MWLEAALTVWQYCMDSANHIFGDRASDDVSQKILDGLASGPLDKTSISKIFHNHLTKDILDEKLDTLQRQGKIRVKQKTSTGGRPRVIYELAG